MAPEYAIHGYLSVKTDVFSFGILLLEIVSGRKNHDKLLGAEKADLLNYVSINKFSILFHIFLNERELLRILPSASWCQFFPEKKQDGLTSLLMAKGSFTDMCMD